MKIDCQTDGDMLIAKGHRTALYVPSVTGPGQCDRQIRAPGHVDNEPTSRGHGFHIAIKGMAWDFSDSARIAFISKPVMHIEVEGLSAYLGCFVGKT